MTPAWRFASRVLMKSAGFPASWLRELQSPLAASARRIVSRERDAGPAAARPLIDAAERDWDGELRRLGEVARWLASAPGMQDAVFADSPDALDGLRAFAGGSAQPALRRAAVRYVQRFCARCELASVGGPLNYGRLDLDAPEPFVVRAAGGGLAARRRVLVSYRAVQAIANAWARDPALAGLLRCYRSARAEPPPDDPLAALATGERTLESIAAELGIGVEAAHQRARRAEAGGWLRTGIRVPVTQGDPLAALRCLVAGSRLAREAGVLDALDLVEDWRVRFEAAELPEREALLGEGERLIAALSRRPPRHAGGTGSDDRLCYTEQAIGNVDGFVVGGRFLEAIGPALEAALDVLATEAVDAREAQRRAVADLVAAAGGAVAADRLLDLPSPAGGDPGARWAAVMASGTCPVDMAPDALRRAGLVRDDLDRWPLFCAPDLMLMPAPGADPERGPWQVMLAEVHHILPPSQLPGVPYDPEPAATLRDLTARVSALAGGDVPALQGIDRRNKARDFTPAGQRLLWLDWLAQEPGADGLRVADCVVDTADGPDRPALRTPDGRRLALFPEYEDAEPSAGMLRALALPQMDKRPVAVGGHTPRVTVGPLIFQRERWNLGPADLPPCGAPEGSFAEYLAVWRWKTDMGMPDQVFARVRPDDRPLFLDFTSPLSVDTFLRDVAGVERLGVEEMLPALDRLWLHAGGEAYCSEIRLTGFRRRADAEAT